MNKMANDYIFVKNTQYGGARCKLNNGFFKLLFLFIFLNLLSFASFGEVTCSLDENGTLTVSGDGILSQWNVTSTVTDMNKITKVEIGNEVTKIESNTFSGCSSLTEVTFEKGFSGEDPALETIGEYAFYDCTKLTSINIPAKVTSIESGAFFGCSSLTEVTFEQGSALKTIGDNAFYDCAKLTTIEIPVGVTSIGSNAFNGCSSLANINIPAKVTSIESNTFSGCSSLKAVTFATGSALKTIGEYAFDGCSSLASIIIPAKVTSIGSNAFNGCSNLTKVTFEKGSSGEAPALKTNPALETIGKYAFDGCSGLTTIEIPAKVTNIGSGAFSGCSNLTKVTFEKGSSGEAPALKTIGDYAFDGCSGLTTIEIPAKVTNIGSGAFSGCSSLTNITVDGGNTAYKDIDGVLFIKDGKQLICYPASKTGETYEVPDSVTSIGSGAFSGCSNLTEVTFKTGSALETIGDYAFSSCSNLTTITIPAKVTSIGSGAFYGCSNLTEVTFKNGSSGEAPALETIGNNAFYGCAKLTTIEIPAKVTKIGDYVFYGCAKLTTIEIPAKVTEIGDGAFSNCINLKTVNFGDDSKLGSIKYGVFEGCSNLATITIPDSVTAIGSKAFSNCINLETVNFGNDSKLGSIGDNAFYGCSNLASIIIPAKVTSIGYGAFYGCSRLASVIFKTDSVLTSIGTSAFYGCAKLTTIEIPATVKSIGYEVFKGCIKLTEIKVDEENTAYVDIDGVLFKNNEKADEEDVETLTLVCYPASKKTDTPYTVPATVTNIEYGAFFGCTKLTEIKVDKSNTVYVAEGGVLFNREKTELICYPAGKTDESYTVPDSVTSIGSGAFSGCTKLTEIKVSEGNTVYVAEGGVLFQKNEEDGVETLMLICYPAGKKDTTYEVPDSVTSIGSGAFYGCELISLMLPAGLTEFSKEDCLYGSNIECLYFKGSKGQWNRLVGGYEYGGDGVSDNSVPVYYLDRKLTLKKKWVGDTYNKGRYRGVPSFIMWKGKYEDESKVQLDKYEAGTYGGSREIYYVTSCKFGDKRDVFDKESDKITITDEAKKVDEWVYTILVFVAEPLGSTYSIEEEKMEYYTASYSTAED